MTEKRKPRRATDAWLPRLLIVSTVVNLIAVFVLAVGSFGVVRNALNIDDTQEALEKAEDALREIRLETVERVEQDCLKEERDHLKDVKNLRRTYRFLLGYPVSAHDDPLYVALIQTLPQTESAARTDNAPPYCDRPNVGLPEPDPVIPERPKALGSQLP